MINRKTVVAVLDDEPKMRSALARLLKTHGYDVELFESGEDFLKVAESGQADCMLLDLHMPRTTGFDVLESLSLMRVPIPAIVITGHDELGNAERVRSLGAADYLLKPLDEATLVDAIERVCRVGVRSPSRDIPPPTYHPDEHHSKIEVPSSLAGRPSPQPEQSASPSAR